MTVTPNASNENLTLADDDGGNPRLNDGEPSDAPLDGQSSEGLADGITNEPLPVPSESADVGLAQKGTDEDAIVRRETQI
ncbi:hypothetical protein MKK68_25105 [Methylobacterium sp. E-016]|uniref:hypothetical protein n=1 Tax=Methylobacterium sp. E-016 TaxID=2836556 RepID=UPI001FBA67A9|nr:hypothetical protein [Methylobacterium sp. E-016]MCJ2078875.1 hypothetical protein [Methylobacterium sp. E-016]